MIVGCDRKGHETEDLFGLALAEVRPGQGRLADAPWLAPAPAGPLSQDLLRKAGRAAAQALGESVTAEKLRKRAVIFLLLGKVGPAVDDLVRAAELAPSDAAVWNDLAVARLQRSVVASDPYEVFLALVAANRAVHSDPALQAGHFNRALLQERLSLHGPAAEEWQLVLARERDPGWSREARELAGALRPEAEPRFDPAAARMAFERGAAAELRNMVAGAPQGFREHLEEKLLGEWALAASQGREREANGTLSFGRAIAETLAKVGADPMAAETIAHIDRAHSFDAARRQRLVAGFLSGSLGLKLAGQGEFSSAIPHFEESRKLLAGEGSPFTHWATYWTARCGYQGSDSARVRAAALRLTRDRATSRFKSLRGRSFLLIGLIDGTHGRHHASSTALTAALAAFRDVGEAPYAAKVSGNLALLLEFLGQGREAWRVMIPALIDPATFEKPEVRFSICEYASWLARQQGEPEIALWLHGEVVENAPKLGLPQAWVGALRQQAMILAELERGSEAVRAIKQARDALQRIGDPAVRRGVEGDVLLAEAEIADEESPRQAIARLNEAIPILRTTGYHLHLGYAYYRRALAERALGRDDAAERDFAAAIAELEQQRGTARREDRISYLDRVEEIFDAMIAFQLERQRPDQAFRWSEQAKARVLWDWIVAGPELPVVEHPELPAASLDELPPGTALIAYAALPQRTVIWVLRRGELRHTVIEVGAGALDGLVQEIHTALSENRSSGLAALSIKAYDLLIRPVAHHLAPADRLVLLPDGALHALPFALLYNRESERYLVQERVLAVAPSARVHAASRGRETDLPRDLGPVLVVTAPAFDRGIDPSLAPLRAANTEVAIVQAFPGSRVLREGKATREAFLAAGDFASIYFGGHSVVNTDFPLLSQMLFASHPADPARGVLYSGDVLRRSFPRTRLVVLASCGSALGRISRTEGVENLARPFLAAGVPAVVASLWNVDDQSTAEFFVRFYEHLGQRPDVARALRATQIESIERGLAPRDWAAFEVIGSA